MTVIHKNRQLWSNIKVLLCTCQEKASSKMISSKYLFPMALFFLTACFLIFKDNYSGRRRRGHRCVATICTTIPFWGCSLAFAFQLPLLSSSFEPRQIKMTYNHLNFLNGQTSPNSLEIYCKFSVGIHI